MLFTFERRSADIRCRSSVAYHLLPALLLNEYQKEHQQLVAEHQMNLEQSENLALLQKKFDAQSVQLANLERLTKTLAAANGINPAKAEQVSQTTEDLARTVVAAR